MKKFGVVPEVYSGRAIQRVQGIRAVYETERFQGVNSSRGRGVVLSVSSKLQWVYKQYGRQEKSSSTQEMRGARRWVQEAEDEQKLDDEITKQEHLATEAERAEKEAAEKLVLSVYSLTYLYLTNL